jgi:hypothetical protein
MKNQYFADINDYRKYGLLRILSGAGQLSISVCWMLTPNDQRTNGNAIAYLSHPSKWRHYDGLLFDALQTCITQQDSREVRWAEEHQLIPAATYFAEALGDRATDRHRYFQGMRQMAAGSDLIFFDPDNGIEVQSVPYGRKNSSKYAYWDELSHTFAAGHSILVYQHFKRVERSAFRAQLAAQFYDQLGVSEIVSFSSAHVLFLLIPREEHRGYLTERCAEISEHWGDQIRVRHHRHE